MKKKLYEGMESSVASTRTIPVLINFKFLLEGILDFHILGKSFQNRIYCFFSIVGCHHHNETEYGCMSLVNKQHGN